MNGVTDAKAMMDKQDRKGGENNLGKKGKNNKLHKLASGCDSDYDGCGLTSMLQHTHTHTQTYTHAGRTQRHCFRWTKVFSVRW